MLWPSHAHVHSWNGDLLCQCTSNSRFLFIGRGSSILRHTTRLTDYRLLSSVSPLVLLPSPHSRPPLTNSSSIYFSLFSSPWFLCSCLSVVCFLWLSVETSHSPHTFPALRTYISEHIHPLTQFKCGLSVHHLSLECVLLVVYHFPKTTQQQLLTAEPVFSL